MHALNPRVRRQYVYQIGFIITPKQEWLDSNGIVDTIGVVDIYGNRFLLSLADIIAIMKDPEAEGKFNSLHQQALRSIKESELLAH